MADKKTFEEIHVAYAGILAKHIFRGASDDGSGNFYIYFSELLAGTLAPVSYTVAQAQAAAIALDFIPGQRVTITNPLGDANNEFRTVARSTSELESMGEGIFRASAMSGPLDFVMGYDLTSDFIFYLYNEKYDNEVRQVGVDYIDAMPFDACDGTRDGGDPTSLTASIFKHNRLSNITVTFGTGHTEIRNVNASNCSITTAFNASSDGCLLYQVNLASGSSVSLTAKAADFTAITLGSINHGAYLGNFNAGQGSTIVAFKSELHGTVGDGLTLSTSSIPAGYIGSGHLDYRGSTFEISGAFHNPINPDVSGVMNLGDCTFAGKFIVSDTTTSGGGCITITAFPTDHPFYVTLTSSPGGSLTFSDASDNLRLQAASRKLTDGGMGDYIAFSVHPFDVSKLIEIDFGIIITAP